MSCDAQSTLLWFWRPATLGFCFIVTLVWLISASALVIPEWWRPDGVCSLTVFCPLHTACSKFSPSQNSIYLERPDGSLLSLSIYKPWEQFWSFHKNITSNTDIPSRLSRAAILLQLPSFAFPLAPAPVLLTAACLAGFNRPSSPPNREKTPTVFWKFRLSSKADQLWPITSLIN